MELEQQRAPRTQVQRQVPLRRVSSQLLRLLLAGCPENARRVHLELGTPLHCLCANARVDTALLAELLRANAAATEVRDGAGRTPLRKLCDNATHRKAECLPLVLEASPSSSSYSSMMAATVASWASELSLIHI